MGRAGLSGRVAPAELARLRARFERRHYVRLPGFFEPEFLALIQKRLRRLEFRTCWDLEGADVRQSPVDKSVTASLCLLHHDRRLFELVEALSGRKPVKGFVGHIFRMLPGCENRLDWHTDAQGQPQRVASLTVNLSDRPIRGGVLQMRGRGGAAAPVSIPYPRPGDAVLFRLDEGLEHRCTEVLGTVPKIVFGSWFEQRELDIPALARP